MSTADYNTEFQRAATVVTEMVALGATFTLTNNGIEGDERWYWSPHPEIMRGAIRRFWQAVPDRSAPGFYAAMIEAIRRLDRGGDHAVR